MATGSLNPEEVRVAELVNVYLAAIGAAAPTTATSTLSTDWHMVGYIDDDSGVTLTPEVSAEAIMKVQSKMPVKYYISELGLTVGLTMNQVSPETTEIYWYGQQWALEAGGNAHMTVPSNVSVADMERAMVVEFTADNDAVTRWYFPRGIVIEREEMTLNKADVRMGLTYHAMDNGGEMFHIYTNDENIYVS